MRQSVSGLRFHSESAFPRHPVLLINLREFYLGKRLSFDDLDCVQGEGVFHSYSSEVLFEI